MDETYVKVRVQWRYYYRAVDKEGYTIDSLLIAKRDTKAALCFFNNENNRLVKIRQCKYLNNFVELIATLNKGQMKKNIAGSLSPAEQLYALAA